MEKNPPLAVYYKTFYWTLSNYFHAYRTAETGMVQTNNTFDRDIKGQIAEVGAKKVANFAIEAGKSLPIVGGLISLLDDMVDSIFDGINQHKFTNKKVAINNIVKSKLNNEVDLSKAISLTAIGIIDLKEKYILYPDLDKNKESNLTKLTNWIEKKIEQAKSFLIEETIITYEEE